MFTEPPILDSPLVLPPAMRTMPPSPLLAPTVRPMLPAEEASPVAMLASPDWMVDFPVFKLTGPLDSPSAVPMSVEPLRPFALAPDDIDIEPPTADEPTASPALNKTLAPRPDDDTPASTDIAPAPSAPWPVPIVTLPLMPLEADDPVPKSMPPLEADTPPRPVSIFTLPPDESAALVLPDDSDTSPPLPLTPLPTAKVTSPPMPLRAAPVLSVTLPELPPAAAPLPTTTLPLDPRLPPSALRTAVVPLRPSSLAPLLTVVEPPMPDTELPA